MKQPVLLARGASKSVRDDDVQMFQKHAPHALIEVVEGAGHSIQSDRPITLASLIASMLHDAPRGEFRVRRSGG